MATVFSITGAAACVIKGSELSKVWVPMPIKYDIWFGKKIKYEV